MAKKAKRAIVYSLEHVLNCEILFKMEWINILGGELKAGK
jgi:hypothetical protein